MDKYFIAMSFYAGLLFFLLTPGVLLSLPPDATLRVKAFVHAIVYIVIYNFTKKPVVNFFMK
jgi:hypothetical protein